MEIYLKKSQTTINHQNMHYHNVITHKEKNHNLS